MANTEEETNIVNEQIDEQTPPQNEQPEQFFFASSTGADKISAAIWRPAGAPRGIVQICHGMAEHIMRYDEFARYLCGQGFLVCGHDHLGHGGSIRDGMRGFFALRGGWDHLIQDVHILRKTMQAKYPKLPYVVFGHSMGSFVARDYAARFGDGLRGAIFCGTGGSNPGARPGKLLAAMQKPMEESPMLNRMAFGSYNERFKDSSQSSSAWLSSDAEQVRKYDEDPLCGFLFTGRGYHDLFDGLCRVSKRGWAKRLPNMPILLIAGKEDPVGGYGKGVEQVYHRLRKAGKRAQLRLYEGMRHEILNEQGNGRVYADIASWLDNGCSIP